jgi:hypothetical protein
VPTEQIVDRVLCWQRPSSFGAAMLSDRRHRSGFVGPPRPGSARPRAGNRLRLAMAWRWEGFLGKAGLSAELGCHGSPVARVGWATRGAARRRGPWPRRRGRSRAVGDAADHLRPGPPPLCSNGVLQRCERPSGGCWSPRQDPVAGLVPRAGGVDDEDLAKPIHERGETIASRAHNLAEHDARWHALDGRAASPGRYEIGLTAQPGRPSTAKPGHGTGRSARPTDVADNYGRLSVHPAS